MKRLLYRTIFLMLLIVVPMTTMAEVNISFGISLPPPIVFEAPPDMIVLPDTDNVYVVPDSDADVFFWNGWWWRPWEGRWYRSHYYNRGWGYYNSIPLFYFDVDPGWRGYYRERNWYGHRWNYDRIPNQQLQRNWRGWQNNKHWEKRGTWGVQNYQPRPQHQRQELRNQRQQQYQKRPEVQQHRERIKDKQRLPQVQERRKPEFQKQQPRELQVQKQRKPQVQKQQQRKLRVEKPEKQRESKQSQEKPERGDSEHRR